MKLQLLLVTTLFVGSIAHAQNINDKDTAFNEPAKAQGTQILLGFAELLAAEQLYPGLEKEAREVKAAKADLQRTSKLLTSETERTRAIKAIQENPNNYYAVTEIRWYGLPIGMPRIEKTGAVAMNEDASDRIEQWKSATVVSKVEKEEAILLAESNLTKARAVALKAASEKGLLEKSIKGARVVGTTLLVADVAGRVYVWNALDANPTLSPGATYVKHMMKK